jgi:hypothetical protein
MLPPGARAPGPHRNPCQDAFSQPGLAHTASPRFHFFRCEMLVESGSRSSRRVTAVTSVSQPIRASRSSDRPTRAGALLSRSPRFATEARRSYVQGPGLPRVVAFSHVNLNTTYAAGRITSDDRSSCSPASSRFPLPDVTVEFAALWCETRNQTGNEKALRRSERVS